MTHMFQWEDRGVCVRYLGAVSFEEIALAHAELLEDTRMGAATYQICDMTRADRIDLSKAEAERIARLDSVCAETDHMKVALVVPDEAFLRSLGAYADALDAGHCTARVFDRSESARLWARDDG